MANSEHPAPGTLRRLSSFSELPMEQLELLAEKLEIHTARKGTRLLTRGSRDPVMFYLLQGSIRLRAEDGADKLITHQDPSARAPVARLRPSRYDVVAASEIHYLKLDAELIDDADSSLENASSLTVDTTYQVDEDPEMSALGAENQLTVQIYEDLNQDQLLLPSLPDIAIKVGQTINDDYADANRVAHVLENDPTIAAKLLKVSNSARYAGAQPVARLRDAVARLGLNAVHQLVITFALRELFRSNSPTLNQHMRQLWEHSRQVAAIAHVIAGQCPRLDADTALLAGLVHDIGSVAVLGYARDFPEVANDLHTLQSSINNLRAQLGNMILVKWHLPSSIAQVAMDAERWQRTHEGPCDYTDLVIVAKLHARMNSKSESELPAVDQVPAFSKLGLQRESSDEGMGILEQARDEIRETLSLLGP